MLIPPRSLRSTKKTAPSFRKVVSHRQSSSCNSTTRMFTKALSRRPCNVTKWTSKHSVCMGKLLQIYVSSISYSFSLSSEQKLKHIWHHETLKYVGDTHPPPPPGGLKKAPSISPEVATKCKSLFPSNTRILGSVTKHVEQRLPKNMSKHCHLPGEVHNFIS